jgi:hypothetical protein
MTPNIETSFKVNLFRDPTITWLYKRRLDNLTHTTPVGTNAEEECISLMKILRQAANECPGTKRKWHRKTGLRNWDENVKQITDKQEAYCYIYEVSLDTRQ